MNEKILIRTIPSHDTERNILAFEMLNRTWKYDARKDE
jgi:hypothetical protein